MAVGTFRRVTSLGALSFLMIVILGVWYVTRPARLGPLAETLLSNVLGGRVSVSHAHLSFSGTLLLSDVKLRTDESLAPGNPSASRSLPVFSADEIEARFDWFSLLSGKLSATQLTAVHPTLFLLEDPVTNHWNYELLHGTSVGASRSAASTSNPSTLPVILLREACVQWGEIHGDSIEETSRTIVDGQLTPEPASPVTYHFQIARHGMDSFRLSNGGRGGYADALITGTWDVVNNHFSAVCDQITLADNIRLALPRPIRQWWDEHQLQGSLSQFRITFDQEDGLVVDMTLDGVSLVQTVQPQPAENSHPPQTFAIPITNIHCSLRFGITKPSLQLTGLRGEVLHFPFSAEANFHGFNLESPFELSLHFNRAKLTPDYPPLFVAYAPCQELLQRIEPLGVFDLDVSLKRLSWNGRVLVDGAIACHDAQMRFGPFPYPLDHVNGRILFDNDTCTFDHVAAHAEESPVSINGVLGISARHRAVDFTVSSDNAVFDDRLGDCLPDKYKAIWDQFSLLGHGGFICQILHPETNDPAVHSTITVDVTINDARGYMKMLPYPFAHASGHLVFANDQTRIDHLSLCTGIDKSGTITLDGVVKYPGGDVSNLKPDIQIAADVPVDKDLFALLPPQFGARLSDIDLTGRVDFQGAVKSNSGAATFVEVVGDLALKDAKLTAPAAHVAFKDLTALAHITPGKLELQKMSAVTPEGIHLAATGSADFPTATAAFNVTAQGHDISLPADPPLLLPEDLRTAWSTYKPAGKIDLNASVSMLIAPDAAAQTPSLTTQNWSLSLTAKSLALAKASWPEPIHDITGTITATPARVTFTKIEAVTDHVIIGLNGTYEIDTGACAFTGAANADAPPQKWFAKLPAPLAHFLVVNKPDGQLQLTLNHLNRAAASKPWQFDGALVVTSFATNGPPTSVVLAAKAISIDVAGTYDHAATDLDLNGLLKGTNVIVSGKTLDSLTARIAVIPEEKKLKFIDVDGKVAGGSLQGDLAVHFDENPGFQAHLTLNDADLALLTLPRGASEEERNKIGTGRVSATLALQQFFGDAQGNGADRNGRGELVVRDGKIYNVPLAMGLMQLATLRLPVAGAFDKASMTYYLRDNKITFERILLESPGINLAGQGTVSIKDSPATLDLNFVTDSPDAIPLPLINFFVQQLRNGILQLSVTGNINDPKINAVPFNPLLSTLEALLPSRSKSSSP